MKKEEILQVISNRIDVIETVLSEISEREDYPVIHDKIASLGNYDTKDAAFMQALTKFVINNSDTFLSRPGIGGGVMRKSFVDKKISDKKQQKLDAKKQKNGRSAAIKDEVSKHLNAKIEANAMEMQKDSSDTVEVKFPLDEDEEV